MLYSLICITYLTPLFIACNLRNSLNTPAPLSDIYKIQSLKLQEKQRKQLFRDGINQNKNIPSESSVTSGETRRRNRRFSRDKKLIETKILSSKDLKPDEICILSKGLNFCPTPNKINEEQLSADLETFARSLRIKEYFLAKERDFPVNGSSDSEDDNEIPLPRFKKKKLMESKTQQKYKFRILY